MSKKTFLLAQLKISKKYAGKYVAVVDDKIVTSGHDRIEVYKVATKGLPPSKEIGIYYIPTKEEMLIAL